MNEWTLGVQRSITQNLVVEAAYVGSQGHRLKKMTSLNMPAPGPGTVANRRPIPQFGYLQYPDTIGNSNYNALQLKLEQRFSHGVTLLSAYTYSKSIDDTSGVRPGSGDVLTPNNPFNLNSGERASSTFDTRHRWVTSGFIDLPVGKGKRFLSNAGAFSNAGYRITGSNVGFAVTGTPFGEGQIDGARLLCRVFSRTQAPAIYLETWTPCTDNWETDVAADAAWLRISIANLGTALSSVAQAP